MNDLDISAHAMVGDEGNRFGDLTAWLRAQLAPPGSPGSTSARRRTLLISCAIVFLLGLSLRLLYWHDAATEIARGDSTMQALGRPYRDEARRMLDGGGLLFPNGPVDRADARMIAHPPGYAILMAASSRLFGDTDTPVRLLQLILAAAQAMIVVLIAAELLPAATAIIAGLIVALSPHLAYYSVFLSPDSLAVLPILSAAYLIVRALRQPSLAMMLGAGVLLGLSCWLRSNALFLSLFFAAAVLLSAGREKRWRYSTTLAAAALAVIAPITVRNWIVYRAFIPVSIGAGLNLMEGIGDYDPQGRFGLPALDPDVLRMEMEWHGRPDYGGGLYSPDGIERDRERFSRGAAVVRSHPVWFGGLMLRRMLYMLRYNDYRFENPGLNAPTAPAISASPSFGHDLEVPNDLRPEWSRPISEAGARFVAAGAAVSVDSATALEIAGDDSDFGDQWVSAPISVAKATDYIVSIQIKQSRGPLSVKVRAADPRIVLAMSLIPARTRREAAVDGDPNGNDKLRLQFATREEAELSLVVANNKATSTDRARTDRPEVDLGQANLYRIGATPYSWTRLPRTVIRGVQKNLYRTEWMWLLIAIGLVLLAMARRQRSLLVLLTVPAYYLIVHSVLHTEYRYIMAIQCFFSIIAATTLWLGGRQVARGCRRLADLAVYRTKDSR